jgi:endonuclease V-like protein UPF0215 family
LEQQVPKEPRQLFRALKVTLASKVQLDRKVWKVQEALKEHKDPKEHRASKVNKVSDYKGLKATHHLSRALKGIKAQEDTRVIEELI